ncbi:MAG: NADH-quinone oxidoreductase subunit J, partial [Planctomycetota bacterium]
MTNVIASTPSLVPALAAAQGTVPAWIPNAAFLVVAALTVGSALFAASASRIVHAVFGLMGSFLGVAGLYALLGADFVALAQLLIYVGGILVLLVFAILLTQRLRTRWGPGDRPRRWMAVVVGALVFVGLLAALLSTTWPAHSAVPGEAQPTTAAIGHAFLDPQRSL